MPADELAVVSFNTLGIPFTGSRLASRYARIGALLEAGDADVVCVQEIFTWWHLRLLARPMRSFPHVSYRPSLPGPASGLVTFSRLPVAGTLYRGFGVPPRTAGLPGYELVRGALKGALVTRLRHPGVTIVNTHPLSNRDGDWSPSGRYYPVHRAQLDSLTRTLRGVPGPAVVCGDFNIDRDSALMASFTAGSGLTDAFGAGCPATYRAEYLPPGATPNCIDFILATPGLTPVTAKVLFAASEPLPGGHGYLSDHLGLFATLSVAPRKRPRG